MLPPLKPIAIKERLSVVFVERGEIDVVDGAFVRVDQQGFRVRPVQQGLRSRSSQPWG